MRIRYIGKAFDPDGRLKTHLGEAASRRSRKACWIRSLRACGLKPLVEVLEWVPADSWQEAERAWIEYGLWSGWPLTNGTRGGDGGYVPASWSQEARAKRRMHVLSESHVQILRTNCLGRPRPAGSGSRPGQATVKGAQVGTSKLRESDVLRIRQLLADGVSGKRVAEMFGVTSANVSQIRLRRTWKHL